MIRPKCTRSEFKDGRHLWHEVASGIKYHGDWCAACGMYRFGGRTFFLNDLRGLKRRRRFRSYWGYALAIGIILFAASQYGVVCGWFPPPWRY